MNRYPATYLRELESRIRLIEAMPGTDVMDALDKAQPNVGAPPGYINGANDALIAFAEALLGERPYLSRPGADT